MKIDVQKTSEVERKLSIEVPWERVKGEIETQLGRIRQKAAIKGFRKGKAPLEIVRKMYAEEAHQEAVDHLAAEAVRGALTEHGLTPFGNPYITDVKTEPEQPLFLEAMVELSPIFELADYSSLSLERPVRKVQDKDVEEFLTHIRERNAQSVPVLEDRPLRDGDLALIDYSGTQGGRTLPGMKGEGFRVRIGKSDLVPGFEEQIVGMKVGQTREFDLAFPKDYLNTKLAGQAVHFTVTLKAHHRLEVPEANDGLARSVGQFESIEDLRKAIRQDMQKVRDEEADKALRGNLARALIAANVFETPPSLVDKELRYLVQDFGETLLRAGIPEDKVKEQILSSEQTLKTTAAEHVRLMFVISEIARREGIEATEMDVRNVVEANARRLGKDAGELFSQYEGDGTLNEIHFRLIREKVNEKVLSTSKVQDVESQS